MYVVELKLASQEAQWERFCLMMHGTQETQVLSLGVGVGSPGVGNGNPLQYSCLENSMDGATWGATSLWGHKESNMTGQAAQS